MENDALRRRASGYLPLAVTVLSIVIGFGAAFSAFGIMEAYPPVFAALYVMACFLASFFIQTVLHEFGHFLFGLLSGYRFISFRVGNLMLLRESGRFVVRIFTISGTGGQCLMQPPAVTEKEAPYRLYLLGGCLSNLLFAALFFALSVGLSSPAASVLFLALASVGLITALMNLIPMTVGGVANDGLNTILLGKSADVRRAFRLQLYANGWIASGKRIGELPEEWFPLPEGEALQNPLICTIGVLRYDRQFDRHDFAGARETCEYMLRNGRGLLGVHRNELSCELLFLKILGGCTKAEADMMLTPDLQKYIRTTGSYVSRKRLFYAYELLVNRNPASAAGALHAFEETARRYPYASDVENEREIVALLRETAGEPR